MAIAGKSVKAISETLAEAAHARALIATIDNRLDIVRKAGSLIKHKHLAIASLPQVLKRGDHYHS